MINATFHRNPSFPKRQTQSLYHDLIHLVKEQTQAEIIWL